MWYLCARAVWSLTHSAPCALHSECLFDIDRSRFRTYPEFVNRNVKLMLWTYFERDPESNRWIAWVLDLDVMTVGETLREAMDMAQDAAAMTIEHDLEHGLSLDRRSAPDEIRAKFEDLMARHKARQLDSVVKEEKDFTQVGTQISVRLDIGDQAVASEASPSGIQLAWPAQMCA